MLEGFDLYLVTITDYGANVRNNNDLYANKIFEISTHFRDVCCSDSHIKRNSFYFGFDINNKQDYFRD
jgi:hypothetical protein